MTDHIRQAPAPGPPPRPGRRGTNNAQNLSAQKETEKQSPWVQKENGDRQWPQGPGPQTCQGQSQTDPLRKMPTAPMPWALFLIFCGGKANRLFPSAIHYPQHNHRELKMRWQRCERDTSSPSSPSGTPPYCPLFPRRREGTQTL